MPEQEDIAEHTLALGGTRPAMFPLLGIPWRDTVVFGLAAIHCAMWRWQLLIPLALVFAGSLHLYRKDYNAGRRFLCWLQVSALNLATNVFGGSFVPVRPGKCFRGM